MESMGSGFLTDAQRAALDAALQAKEQGERSLQIGDVDTEEVTL